MRIALVDWVCDPAQVGADGVSDIVWAMATRLAQHGDDVHVVGPYAASAAPDARVNVHPFRPPPPGPRNIIGFMLHCAAAWHAVRRLPGMDIVHAVEYLTAGVVTGLGVRPPVVMTTPCNIDERMTSINPFDVTAVPVYQAMSRVAARRCASIIATSEAMVWWWQKYGVPSKRIVNIPLGVDVRIFRPMPRSEARAQLGWDEAPNVLFAGRADRENGAEFLLRAMADVLRRRPGLRLDMVGAGKGLPGVTALARELGIAERIRWHGRVPYQRLPLYYNASDVFAFPRIIRATPRVLLQALACGMAVVTSAHGAIEDFVRDGESGFLINPREPDQIAARIEELLDDRALANRMGSAAQQFARCELDWDLLVPRIRAQVYQPLHDSRAAEPVRRASTG